MTKHILLYTDDAGEGGVAHCNHSLLCYLAKLGYRVSHAQGVGFNPLIEQQTKLGVQQLSLGFTAGQNFARALKDTTVAETVFADVHPDLIIFSDGWSFSNFAAKQVAINFKIPFIVVLHWIEPSCANFSYGDGISYVDAVSYYFTEAKTVISVSYANLDLIQVFYKPPAGKVQVIYNGVSSEYFSKVDLSTRQALRQQLGISPESTVCFTSARLAPVKGHEYQLRAIEKLKTTEIWQNLYFIWAGTGAKNKYINSESQLREIVRKLRIEDKVKILGHRTDVLDLLAASDIFVLTSKAEGMPISIMEAMAKGLPVIASAVSGIPEELGNTGKLLPDPNVDPQATIQELASTVENWSSNSNLRYSIGQGCKERAQSMFTEHRMLHKYEVVIRKVLNLSSNDRPQEEQIPLSLEAQKMKTCLSYGSLVWNAWSIYHQGRLEEAIVLLQKSLRYTPFLGVETVLNWIENFSKFSSDENIKLDTYSLVNSKEWKYLVEYVRSESVRNQN